MALALFAVPFLDELGSGAATASAPELASGFGFSPGLAAGAMLAAFSVLSVALEAPLLALADRSRVRVVSASALAAVAGATALAALAPGPGTLFLAFALYGPAAGCALAASEGALVEARPHLRERTLTRLMLAGAAGDLAVPGLLLACQAAGGSWRAALGLGALASAALALAHARARALDRPLRFGAGEPAEASRPPLRELLHVLRGRPALLGWCLLEVTAGLLDEVLVAFAVVHLDAHTGAGLGERALALAAFTGGGLAGLALLERLLARVSGLRVLTLTAPLALTSLAVFTATRSVPLATLALFALGAGAATFHPIVSARAYAALPGRPALVGAAASLFTPLEVAAPLALAALAAAWGSAAPLVVLALAPIAVGAAALRARERAER